MTSPRPNADDPTSGMTSTMTYTFPLLTIIWGGIFPSGLILYWIVYTAYLVVQQYLIMGWGNLFPIFGWQPGWAPSPEAGITPASRPNRTDTDAASTEATPPTQPRAPSSGAARGNPRPGNRPKGSAKRRGRKTMTFREFTGKNVEEAIRTAMAEFSADLSELDIEILAQGSRGVLGVGAEEARILAAPKSAVAAAESVRVESMPTEDDRAEAAPEDATAPQPEFVAAFEAPAPPDGAGSGRPRGRGRRCRRAGRRAGARRRRPPCARQPWARRRAATDASETASTRSASRARTARHASRAPTAGRASRRRSCRASRSRS